MQLALELALDDAGLPPGTIGFIPPRLVALDGLVTKEIKNRRVH